MAREKVVLAYSGGLDTSVILHWIAHRGYDVVALLLDLGQPVDDLEALRRKGEQVGAAKSVVQDVKEEFVRDFVFPALQFNALYEGTYLLGTSLARPLIAKAQIELARREGAGTVAHGATGKGNDQVRFELTYLALNPDIRIIAPWKLPEFYRALPGRRELIAYAEQHHIPVKATLAQPWSSDENLMHISFEAGMLEDPWQAPRDEMFEMTADPRQAPDRAQEVLIRFEAGVPVAVDGERLSPARLLAHLNTVGGAHGIGRVDMVESRYVGMKSRGVYETPGGTILHVAHRAMESITLDRDVIQLKDSLMPRFARLVYNGFWYSPEMRVLLALLPETQRAVTGTVRLQLYKGACQVTGRQSPYSLYDTAVVSMEADQGAYNPQDAVGFIRLNALTLKADHRQRKKLEEGK
ncbi:MAG: argininosuccinate synthase [Candidatus Lambdaproteobacteria bacterium]|nr:argininosuccinate synthase [Candidatus Lambdaproteobacteria bacterium]